MKSVTTPRRHIPDHPLLPYLRPFAGLLQSQGADIREEAEANKAWHLGAKEYEYVITPTGHIPAPIR